MRTFGRKAFATLAALLLCGLASESAWAKAFDMEMTGISVTAENPADQVGPNIFYLGATIKINCSYRWGEFPLNNPPPPLLIQFYHSPGDKGHVNFTAASVGPPAATGTVKTASASFLTYGVGDFKILCEIMRKEGTLGDANVANNKKEVFITVKARAVKLGSAGLSPAAAKPGMGIVPGMSGHVKQCPTSLSAAVKVDAHQLTHPLNSPADMAETKVMLHLKQSQAAGNNVVCHYATHNKDVPDLVVTIKCPNASAQSGKAGSFNCTN
jgi:hypothetical protein